MEGPGADPGGFLKTELIEKKKNGCQQKI